MTTITFNADKDLVEAARERASKSGTTLEAELQRWLADYAQRAEEVRKAMEAVDRLSSYIDTGGQKFTREELNERGLADYAQRTEEVRETKALLEELRRYARTGGRKFTREEMNER